MLCAEAGAWRSSPSGGPAQPFSPQTFGGTKSLGFGFAFGGTACFANPASVAFSCFTLAGSLSARFVCSYGSSFRLNSSTDLLPSAFAGPSVGRRLWQVLTLWLRGRGGTLS